MKINNLSDMVYISDAVKLHEGFTEKMKQCLYAAEKHGIVFGQLLDDKESLIKTAIKYLPEYSVTETVNADCMMIKKSVADMFGVPGHSGDLKDYCAKINSYGYSAIIAHHALYSYIDGNAGATGPEKGKNNEKQTANKKSKTGAVRSAAGKAYPENPAVHFIKLLDDEYYPRKRILFECTNLPPTHCGTSEVMLAAFESFTKLFGDKYDISMLTNREAAVYHNLEDKYENIVYPDTICGTYHLGYVPVQMHNYDSQLLLNKHCLKIAAQILDIIMVRSYRLHDLCAKANVELGIRISDGITFISRFSRDDFLAYYASDESVKAKKLKVIYVAKELTEAVNNDIELPFKDFVLIVGNTFKHKVIRETLDAINAGGSNNNTRGSKGSTAAGTAQRNCIVVGAKKTGLIRKNIYGYKSGNLSEGFMNKLYSSCDALIFPSVYEGFGLPVIMALRNGKSAIVNDNELNRELQTMLKGFEDKFIFYEKFEEIPQLVETACRKGKEGISIDTQSEAINPQSEAINPQSEAMFKGFDSWDAAATELEVFFDELLAEKTDIERIKERWWIYNQIEERAALKKVDDYKLASFIKFALKENIKHRHKGLHRFLKKLRGS